MVNENDGTANTAKPTQSLKPSSKSLTEHVYRYMISVSSGKGCLKRAKAAHFCCLKKMVDQFPNVIILDKHNDILDHSALSPMKAGVYDDHFELYKIPKNLYRGKGFELYAVAHSIRSTNSFVHIRSLLSDEVKESKGCKTKISIHEHLWPIEDLDIVQLGFIQGVDPNNFLRENFRETFHDLISESNNNFCPRPFQCYHSSPLFVDDSGRNKTRAYSVECRRRDAQDLLQQLYKFNARAKCEFQVVFYRLRHHKADRFKQAVIDQTTFLEDTRVIPIEGVSLELMEYCKSDIMEIDGIDAILHHKRTHSHGRWNLLTDRHHFKQATKSVHQILPYLFEDYDNLVNLDPSSFPRLGFQNQHDSSSDVTALDSSFPPELAPKMTDHASAPADYKSVVTGSCYSTSPQPSSKLVSDIDQVNEEKAQLQQQLLEAREETAHVKQQLHELSERSKEQSVQLQELSEQLQLLQANMDQRSAPTFKEATLPSSVTQTVNTVPQEVSSPHHSFSPPPPPLPASSISPTPASTNKKKQQLKAGAAVPQARVASSETSVLSPAEAQIQQRISAASSSSAPILLNSTTIQTVSSPHPNSGRKKRKPKRNNQHKRKPTADAALPTQAPPARPPASASSNPTSVLPPARSPQTALQSQAYSKCPF